MEMRQLMVVMVAVESASLTELTDDYIDPQATEYGECVGAVRHGQLDG